MATIDAVFDNAEALPRGRHRLTREQVVASQRGRLLAAMADAVAEKGYAHTTVADVTTRAGVSSKTFYQQFPDKEAAFLAAYDACVEAVQRSVAADLGSPDEPPLVRCDRALGAYLEALAEQPALGRTFLIEVHAAGEKALERRSRNQARMAQLLAELMAPSIPGGRARQELKFACEAFVGAFNYLVTTRIAAGELDQLPKLRQPLLRLIARILAALEAEGAAEAAAAAARAKA
jgi:AcrR family transcriptional regulator